MNNLQSTLPQRAEENPGELLLKSNKRSSKMLAESLDKYTLDELKDEADIGLRVEAETAWGWVELKVGKFLSAVEKRGGPVVAYGEIRRCGGLTIKVPRRA
jgi:hypothetical protein